MNVVCFDLDDTLISERSYVESGLRAVGRHLDAALHLPAGRSGAWLVDEWRRHRAGDVYQRFLLAHGGAGEVDVGELVSIYRRHAPEVSLRPGSVDVLEALRARGDRLALISDGHAVSQRAKWEALRMPLEFDPVIFTDEWGKDAWKPNPWAFRTVMQRWPSAARYVYVADNPEKDFVAPNRLGWTTVQVIDEDNLRPPGDPVGEARPTFAVRHLRELLGIP